LTATGQEAAAPTTIVIERAPPILEITLARPPANAVTAQLARELHAALVLLRDDPALRVGIISGGTGRIFCAGWDLKDAALATDPTEANQAIMDLPGGFAGITEFWNLGKPLIAAVNGFAIGGGFEIALACDIILAAEQAAFALPEMQRGFVPDAGAVQRLPRRVPYNVAMEMMLTGRRMSAQEAAQWGLVHAVMPSADLPARAREMALTIADGAPLAVQALLEVMPAVDRLPLPEAFANLRHPAGSLPAYERMLVSEDFLEGPRAFAEKRLPVWRGR
jgi:crotonobetainyl-CoA hydratase